MHLKALLLFAHISSLSASMNICLDHMRKIDVTADPPSSDFLDLAKIKRGKIFNFEVSLKRVCEIRGRIPNPANQASTTYINMYEIFNWTNKTLKFLNKIVPAIKKYI